MTHVRRSHKTKGHHEEEHENHERWLVSYADMVTLLMCLFIVLFAMSQIDIKKFDALSEGLKDGFNAPIAVVTDGNSPSPNPSATIGGAAPAPVDLGAEAAADGHQQTAEEKAAEAAVQRKQLQQTQREAQTTYDNLKQIRDRVDAALTAAGYPNTARYTIDSRGLVISILADQVLFDSAKADLRPEGERILQAVAPVLANLPNNLSIDGHANNIPVDPNGPWPSNWELSAYRATTVLRYLAADGNIAQARMVATGMSDTKPLVPNSDPNAVTLNRRVDIVVLSNASAAANALLPGLAAINHFH